MKRISREGFSFLYQWPFVPDLLRPELSYFRSFLWWWNMHLAVSGCTSILFYNVTAIPGGVMWFQCKLMSPWAGQIFPSKAMSTSLRGGLKWDCVSFEVSRDKKGSIFSKERESAPEFLCASVENLLLPRGGDCWFLIISELLSRKILQAKNKQNTKGSVIIHK